MVLWWGLGLAAFLAASAIVGVAVWREVDARLDRDLPLLEDLADCPHLWRDRQTVQVCLYCNTRIPREDHTAPYPAPTARP